MAKIGAPQRVVERPDPQVAPAERPAPPVREPNPNR